MAGWSQSTTVRTAVSEGQREYKKKTHDCGNETKSLVPDFLYKKATKGAEKMSFTINILGSEWTVYVKQKDEDKRLMGCSGFTDWTVREIVILDCREDGNLKNLEAFMMKVLKHEIVHAYMFESGLGDDWEHLSAGHEETVVDWIAFQMVKIVSTYGNAAVKLKEMLKNDGTGKDLQAG